jgi:cytochrome c oxidase subunit I
MAQAELKAAPSPTPPPLLGNERKWTDYFTFSTDHKVIGIQYLVTGFIFYMIGGAFVQN